MRKFLTLQKLDTLGVCIPIDMIISVEESAICINDEIDEKFVDITYKISDTGFKTVSVTDPCNDIITAMKEL